MTKVAICRGTTVCATNLSTVSTSDVGKSGNESAILTDAGALDTGPLAEVAVPAQADWTDQGQIFAAGTTADWDARLSGMISPCTVLKMDDGYHLYYVGADKPDRGDAGPAHRKLGVAVSSDGANFTKYGSNPVLTHAEGIENCDECGVFSAGGVLDSDDTAVIYFGGMTEVTPGSVNSDGDLVTSSDGYAFDSTGHTMVIDHTSTDVYGYGDEIYPIGAWRSGSTWYVYYIGQSWSVGLGSGPARNNLTSFEEVLSSAEFRGCGDPIDISTSKVVVPMLTSERAIQMRVTATTALSNLDTLEQTYTWSTMKHATLYMDRASETWFMYYRDSAAAGIRLKTASVGYV